MASVPACVRERSRRGKVYRGFAKRAVDVVIGALGLALTAPLLVLIAAAVKLDSRGPVIFKQERVGLRFRSFRIYKFRTMVAEAPSLGPDITVGTDARITRVGRILRKTKLDELPQLFNIIKGEMSLVGPRPEVPKYVDAFRSDYEEILEVRPGMTDLASIKFIDEASILARSTDPDASYRHEVLPEKIALAKEYVRTQSLRLDAIVIGRTLAKLLNGSSEP